MIPRVTDDGDRRPGLEELRLYDTRTRSVQPFAPLAPAEGRHLHLRADRVRPADLGNMRSQLFPDLLRRVLLVAGYDVTYVTNVTDVGHLVADRDDTDDKMELAAEASGKTAAEIAALLHGAVGRRPPAPRVPRAGPRAPRRRPTSTSRSRWCRPSRRAATPT